MQLGTGENTRERVPVVMDVLSIPGFSWCDLSTTERSIGAKEGALSSAKRSTNACERGSARPPREHQDRETVVAPRKYQVQEGAAEMGSTKTECPTEFVADARDSSPQRVRSASSAL